MSRPSITQAMRQGVATRHGGRPGEVVEIGCVYCGDAIFIDWRGKRVHFVDVLGRFWPELDHIVPLYWDGPHTIDNLVPACLSCNRSKGPRRLADSA